MQQIIHCVEEALSAYEAREDMLHVQADLEQAEELIQIALKWARERK
jgi:phage baseplate assembly protein W